MKSLMLLSFALFTGCVALDATTTSSQTQAVTGPNTVEDWHSRAQTAIAAGSRPSASGFYLQAMVQLAVYDAVVAIDGGYESYATDIDAPDGASLDAAIATAAWRVVRTRVPTQAASIDAQYTTFLATIADGQAKTDGVTVGEAAAAGILAARTGDHFDDVVTYVQPTTGPGVWEPTATTPPVDYKLRYVIPYTIAAPGDRRPPPPEPLTSRHYARDFDELVAYGSINSTTRTADQTDTAKFWTESGYTLWTRNFRTIATDHELSNDDAARLFAMGHLAAADTMLDTWEAKYYYSRWRPVQAITRADTDGNARTTQDTTWVPLLNQNHPEYPSGHGTAGSAFTTTLHRFFHDDISITLNSTVVGLTNPVHTYASLDDVGSETTNARTWGGIHFRETTDRSERISKETTRDILRHRFRKLRDGHGHGHDCDDDDRE